MNSFVRLSFVPQHYRFALFLLRVWVGLSLFLAHGLEKITGFSQMAAHFPDPLHIGAKWSLAFALCSDAICSLLLIIGFGTRWVALFIAINTGVAFVFVHHMRFFGEGNGELPWLYLGVMLTLVIAGGGSFSADGGQHQEGQGRSGRYKR
jgi:putative oxidoreductase